eukprot:gene26617-biopygen17003
MSQGVCSRPESSWNRSCRSPQLRFQLDSGREHPP